MTLFRADLHCHSTCSDGSHTPHELVDLALQQGLQGLSITDHDTIAAYPEIIAYGEKVGLKIIPGIEFSTTYEGETIHLLGYAFDTQSSLLRLFCQEHLIAREERLRKILEKLDQKGFHISESERALFFKKCANGESIGRPHIAEALLKIGLVANIREAFDKYLGKGKPFYVPIRPFTVEETLHVIHTAGGFGVLAHPHLIKNRTLCTTLLNLPFDGIEARYAIFAEETNAYWIHEAKQRKLLMTGGSDFHGLAKPMIPLGSAWTDQTTFDILYHKSRSRER